ncbi:hypothetical protein F4820DRAFT_454655 [Hypoxylon rubiginosum]|uniref:Uncharacterized protein n=1 Tax=Hypoxylon rubiginosum TaxID=110542 RepID=A0ACB9YGT2_9PEZI|nr:hypothetical protein F4820DRAFT_454655 [Hypoxylon rubiginosum]
MIRNRSPGPFRARVIMTVCVFSVLRLLRDLDNISRQPAERDGLYVLYLVFVLASAAFLFSSGLIITEERARRLVAGAQPKSAGVLAIGAYIFCEPFQDTFGWFYGVTWWFWAAYLLEMK